MIVMGRAVCAYRFTRARTSSTVIAEHSAGWSSTAHQCSTPASSDSEPVLQRSGPLPRGRGRGPGGGGGRRRGAYHSSFFFSLASSLLNQSAALRSWRFSISAFVYPRASKSTAPFATWQRSQESAFVFVTRWLLAK